MANETPSQYRARVAANAAKSGTKPPVQSGPVPTPGFKPLVLPKVVEVQPKPAYGPGTVRTTSGGGGGGF